MRQNLHKRLGRLEAVSAAARRARESSANQSGLTATIEWLRETLRSYGIEQRPEESLANTFARALGMSDSELDDYLRASACRQ
jgi:hypothetical protein